MTANKAIFPDLLQNLRSFIPNGFDFFASAAKVSDSKADILGGDAMNPGTATYFLEWLEDHQVQNRQKAEEPHCRSRVYRGF